MGATMRQSTLLTLRSFRKSFRRGGRAQTSFCASLFGDLLKNWPKRTIDMQVRKIGNTATNDRRFS
jgi:hypothetical protein